METKFHVAGLQQFRVDGNEPTLLLPRGGPGVVWLTPAGSFGDGVEPRWMTVRSGDHVLVAARPYLTTNRDPAWAILLAAAVGAQAVAQCPGPVVELHVFATDVEDLSPAGDDRFRIYLGFAVRTQ